MKLNYSLNVLALCKQNSIQNFEKSAQVVVMSTSIQL